MAPSVVHIYLVMSALTWTQTTVYTHTRILITLLANDYRPWKEPFQGLGPGLGLCQNLTLSLASILGILQTTLGIDYLQMVTDFEKNENPTCLRLIKVLISSVEIKKKREQSDDLYDSVRLELRTTLD